VLINERAKGNFGYSKINQESKFVSWEHVRIVYVSSRNEAYTKTTDLLRRKLVNGGMKTDRQTDREPPPPPVGGDDDRGKSNFNTYSEPRGTNLCPPTTSSTCNY
jgi:hypothetical protein